MQLDWKDLLEIYNGTQDEEIKAQLEETLKDAPPEILSSVKLKPANETSAIDLWLENLKQMKEG